MKANGVGHGAATATASRAAATAEGTSAERVVDMNSHSRSAWTDPPSVWQYDQVTRSPADVETITPMVADVLTGRPAWEAT